MNQDLKVSIAVFLVVMFSLGFVLLAKPPILKDEESPFLYERNSKVSSEKKSNIDKFLEEDTSIEMMDFSSDTLVKQRKEPTQKVGKENILRKESISKEQIPKENDKELSSKLVDTAQNENSSFDEVPDNSSVPSRKVLDEDMQYIVKSGDTLSSIAREFYQDSKKHLMISKANNDIKSSDLKVGMKLLVPSFKNLEKYDVLANKSVPEAKNGLTKPVIYRVKEGDTISAIARKVNGGKHSVADFKKANPSKDLTRLKIGETLTVPMKQ